MPLTRRLILQKARHHPKKGSDGLSTHGFRNYFTPLPGYFSPFPHGTHTLSVTKSIQAYRVVPADSQQIPRARCYSGTPSTHTLHAFTYRTLTVYGRPFQTTSANTQHTRGAWQHSTTMSHNPTHATPARYHTHMV